MGGFPGALADLEGMEIIFLIQRCQSYNDE